MSVKVLGSLDEMFQRMSVEENLLLPSLKKISAFDYIGFSKRIRDIFMSEMKQDTTQKGLGIKELKINELVELTLARWYICLLYTSSIRISIFSITSPPVVVDFSKEKSPVLRKTGCYDVCRGSSMITFTACKKYSI